MTDTLASGFTFSPLTPSAFLARSGLVHAGRVAVVDGVRSYTYGELLDRARRGAGALVAAGVAPGDRVAVLATNSHLMLECHHAVPMAGAVLVPLNIRLTATELAWIVEHAGASVLVATDELASLAAEVCGRTGARLVEATEWDAMLAAAEPTEVACTDERALLAINYTSGTTGRPKGVMYHHRGAYLQALAMALHAGLSARTRYLWTLPMFHCNGWCFPWAVTAAGGTHVCLRQVDAAEIWRLLREAGITHLSAAPTVLTMIANAQDAAPLADRVQVHTGGAPPGPALLETMGDLGFDVTHLYGLTETYGPLAVNDWHPEWDERTAAERAELTARQGVGNVIADQLRVVDVTGADVPADGATVGEIVARGNDVMLGYYRNAEATADVTVRRADGHWFRTGDLAVMHADGYLEIRDRSKDVIISGGENISSVEVERALDRHPAVLESAVVASPDDQWGEVPVAYVTLRDGAQVTGDELVAFLRERLAGFKVPRTYQYGTLPKTSTGKVQKHVLRERTREP